MTLVELLVAMAVGLIVALAATAALIAARRGFATVDAASQLRDDGRFAAHLIQRLAVQAGYKDLIHAATSRGNAQALGTDPLPSVFGFDNAVADQNSLSTAKPRPDARSYGDVLVLRYQPTETFPGSGEVDKSMIDCLGNPADALATDRDDMRTSVLFVAPSSDGEPALKCYRSNSAFLPFAPAQPLVTGVEDFQVLYGVDGVQPNAIPDPHANLDAVPERYLRADEMTVQGNDAATHANWRRVRSLRIGLVLRSAPGAAQQSTPQTLYPLGSAAFASNDDKGTIFHAPADGRVRQVVNFTVHLRNDQGL